MTYVMGNVCGRYEKYKRMLKETNFTETDELYVAGDLVDIGDDPVKLLTDMSMRANVFSVMGDREYTALKLMRMSEKERCEKYEREYRDWLFDGGEITMLQFSMLGEEERLALFEYMEELPLYEEITVNRTKYVIKHSKENILDAERGSDESASGELGEYTLIVGHGIGGIKIKREDGVICMNCGEKKTDPLAVLCLDTDKEYYF